MLPVVGLRVGTRQLFVVDAAPPDPEVLPAARVVAKLDDVLVEPKPEARGTTTCHAEPGGTLTLTSGAGTLRAKEGRGRRGRPAAGDTGASDEQARASSAQTAGAPVRSAPRIGRRSHGGNAAQGPFARGRDGTRVEDVGAEVQTVVHARKRPDRASGKTRVPPFSAT